VAWVLPFALFGCGLVSGLDGLTVGDASVDAGGDGGGSDAGASDGAPADVQIGPACEAGACGAPVGFQPILFATDQSTACAGSTDVIVDPGSAPPGACSCTCSTTATCYPQTLAFSTGASCHIPVSTSIVLDGGCDPASNTQIPSPIAVGPFPLGAGSSCSSSVVKTGTIPSTPGRLCGVAACDVCTAPAGYKLCYYAPGAVSCPNGTTPHVVATSAALACSSCTACSISGKCGGTMRLYADSACSQILASAPVDGTCVPSSGNFKSGGGIVYTATLLDAGCTPGASTASRSLTAQGTVCCP
jgi:hypothetical protein